MSTPSVPAHYLPQLEPNQVQWSKYMIQVYINQKGPEPLGTVVFEEIEEKAKEKLKHLPGAFLYAGGSAGTSSTEHANASYFRSLRIIPRMLRATNTRSLSTTLFGFRYPSPILLAPIGVQGTFYAEGELAPARAAGKLGVPFVCSTASTRSIEQVARANDEFAKIVPSEKGDGTPDPNKGALWNLSLINQQPEGGALAPRWYQLYWPVHESMTRSLLSRAKASGYTALVITLDTMLLGWRPHDLERSYLPFGHGVGIETGRSDPAFMALHNRKPMTDYEPPFPYLPNEILARARGVKGTEEEQAKAKDDIYLGQNWLQASSGTCRRWEDLELVLKEWEGPVLLKGVQSVRDAEKAVEMLMKNGREGGIVVSNHGGRQVDGAIPSILALQRILASKKIQKARNPPPGSGQKKFHVLFDSGIRTGTDILKAVMLGADAVMVGRPYVYASIVSGQAGVEQVIKCLLADLETSMGLAGWDSLDEVRGKGLKGVLASLKGNGHGEMAGVDDDEDDEVLIKADC